MNALYLIRHGQASARADDYDRLSPLGEQQAHHLGQELVRRGLAPVQRVSGTLLRHRQTAEHCARGAGWQGEVPTQAGWNEYDHQAILGAWNPDYATARGFNAALAAADNPHQLARHAFREAFGRWLSGRYDADYQEPFEAFRARVLNALEAQHQAWPGGPVLIFTSGGPISLITQALLGLPQDQFLRVNASLVNGGITKLVPGRKGFHLASLNEHTAFEGKPDWLTHV